MNPKSTKSRYHYLTGVWDVVIMKGYDSEDRTRLIVQKCPTCHKDKIGYFSRTGEPKPELKNIRCEDCLQEEINKCGTHTEMLSK